MNEDNLHHPEPEQPDNGPALKKRARCHMSSLWELFTEDVDPQHQTCSTCHNCHKSIVYHKKSERVKNHLIKCPMFTKSMMEMDEDSCPLVQRVTIKQGTEVWTIFFVRTICVADINETVLSFLS